MVSIESDSEINRIENLKDKDTLLKELKDYYQKTGTIRSGYIAQINDQTDFSFEEFRDLFKELDVWLWRVKRVYTHFWQALADTWWLIETGR